MSQNTNKPLIRDQMSKYDFVVVGSSPGMMSKPFLRKRNKAVALFESQAELGGAAASRMAKPFV